MAYTKQRLCFDGSASSVTAGPYLIQDFTQLVLSYVTNSGSASALTVQVTSDDGLASALGNFAFSNATVITAQGPFGVETGSRWIRFLRSDSSCTLSYSALVNR